MQALIGFGSGGPFGVGLGEGVQKVYYLPEAHTDMIFAIIGEELGLVGVALVDPRLRRVRLRRVHVALRCPDPFGSGSPRADGADLRPGGVNLGAVLGLAPLTGIPLPFVSYGGSSLLVALAPSAFSLTSP